MTEPLSSPPRPSEGPGAADEDARIEHLLVTGLGHYFAGEFDTAINLWTRVLFLDRRHDRARAYIDRARSAQAERQRQSEALVHQGLDAFDSGDVERARALLSEALESGASHDLALGVLGRIERLGVGVATRAPVSAVRVSRDAAPGGPRRPLTESRRGRAARFWTFSIGAVLVLSIASWWVWTSRTWPDLWPAPAIESRMLSMPDATGPLPTPQAAETYLRRGRALFESGRLRDALPELERVAIGDPLRAEADELRARIQRELLALALIDTPAVSPGPSGLPPE